MNKNNIAIVVQATKSYLLGAETLFYSIKKYNKCANVDLVYTTDEPIHSKAMEYLGAKNYLINNKYKNITKRDCFIETGKKLSSLELDYDRVIQIDADVLCVGDIGELFSSMFDDKDLFAAKDTARHYYSQQMNFDLNMELNFNAGVIIFNRSFLNKREEFLDLLQMNALYSYDGGDQGYLNYYCQKFNIPFGFMDNKYNYVLDPNMPCVNKREIRIIHFTGIKPWSDKRKDFYKEWYETWNETNEECNLYR